MFYLSQDADKANFNCSSRVLTHYEKSILSKGLNFAIQPKDINYVYDYMLPFELLDKNINSLRISNHEKLIIIR